MVKCSVDKQTFLYRILVNPRYRAMRHVLLLLALIVISLNQSVYTYGARTGLLEGYFYLTGLCTLLSYIAISYLHLCLLVPEFLLKKKYLAYIACSSISVLLLLLLRYVQEYWIYTISGILPPREPYFNVVSFLDSLSDFLLNMICITGVSMTVLLKHWMEESERVNQLEKKRMQSEVDGLKEQVNPSLLFNTLNRIGILSESEPQKAADMVLRLSQLLRYQIYDGARDRVLLYSETNFLTDYLALEKFYSDTFDYAVVTEKDLSGVFIPPLLTVPIVQYALKRVENQGKRPVILLEFKRKGDQVCIVCRFDDHTDVMEKELDGMRTRLNLLDPDKYSLSVTQERNAGQSVVALKMNMYGK